MHVQKLLSKYVILSCFFLFSIFLACTSNYDENSATHFLFESVFTHKESLLLPDFIFGDLSHIERAPNGDLLIADQSNSRTWLYLSGEDTWKELVLEDCHPGIETYIVGAAFSDDNIFLINSPSLSGHSFKRDLHHSNLCGVPRYTV